MMLEVATEVVGGGWPFFVVLIAGIGVILAVAFVYSYRVWKVPRRV